MVNIKVFLFWLFLGGALVGTFLFMIYMGYRGVTSGNLFDILFGIFLLSLGLFLPFNFLVKNEKVRNVIMFIFGSSAAIGLFGLWGLMAIGIMVVPFLDVDLTIDLGLIILKSVFVKTLLVIGDVFVVYYLYKSVATYIKSLVKKRKEKASQGL